MIAWDEFVHRIAARGRGRTNFCYVMLLVLQPWLAGLLAGEGSVWAGALGGALVFAGLQTLRRAGRNQPAHFPMLLFCSAGMIAGLAVDRLSVVPFGLAGLCLPGSLDVWHSVARHWALLPYMHAGMLLGSILVLAAGLRRSGYRRAAVDVACGLAMLGSMDAGAWVAGVLNATGWQAWAADGLMPLMWGAMVWSVVLVLLLKRASLTLAGWRPSRHLLPRHLLQGG